MSANSDTMVQVNIKSGEGYDATLVNVYAKTPEELVLLLETVKQNAPLIAEAKATVALAHGIEVKQGSVQTQVQQQPFLGDPNGPVQQSGPPAQQGSWSQPQQQAAPQWSQPAQQGPACKHGPMEWKDFTSKAGNAVKGHFCTGPRNDSCPPLYAKRS